VALLDLGMKEMERRAGSGERGARSGERGAGSGEKRNNFAPQTEIVPRWQSLSERESSNAIVAILAEATISQTIVLQPIYKLSQTMLLTDRDRGRIYVSCPGISISSYIF
jgi:hypothetical protein